MDKVQIYAAQFSLSALTGTIAAKCGVLGWMLLAVCIAMVIDFIAGMIASAKEAIDHPNDPNYGWSSKKGLIGIIKKFGYILVIFVAMIVDFTIYKLSGYLSITPPMNTFFSTLVTAWFILNECLSIIENAGRMGVKSIPKFLTNIISVLKGTVEDKGNVVTDQNEREG